MADNGTLFLDEIGELPLSLQSKLLRVLQEGTIRRLGALKEKRVCTRIIAATNQNMTDLVSKGLFREDLYYRLCVFQLHIPPLRERKEDIPLLAKTLLANQSDAKAVGQVNISEDALERLEHYHWPGNVRELKNALQFALCMMDEPVLHASHLPPHLATDHGQRATPMLFTPPASLKAGMEEAERQLIKNVLANCANHLEGKKQAAKRLNISLATLYNKMKKYRL
nr:sigma 54-interacting transcriptional regulator [Shouchella tritolerans]